MNKKIPVTRSSMPSYEEYCKEIKILWESHWLSNRGCIHKDFERQLQQLLGQPYVFLFSSGHTALEVGISSLRLPVGSEVITTPYTHCSTIHAIVRNGLTPVFCDVNEINYTIDVEQIEKYITPKTAAIVATHVYGVICDVEVIDRIAHKHDIKVIYDAAHAFGVKKDGKDISSWGDMSMFSCHATKVFHTIEGGITVFRDKAPYDIIDDLVNFGFKNAEEVNYISTNARMNEFEAAMGICNLRHFKDDVQKREIVYRRYKDNLSGVCGIKFIPDQKGVTKNYSYMPLFFDGYKYSRNTVQKILESQNIFSRKYFYPIVPELKCYKDLGFSSNFPISFRAAETVLSLPLFSELNIEDVDRICSIILN